MELTADDIQKIAGTYHSWTGDRDAKGEYEDFPGFCYEASLEDIKKHDYVLTPGRYVGAEEVEDDGEPFDDKMLRLTSELKELMDKSSELDKIIWSNLEDLGYGK